MPKINAKTFAEKFLEAAGLEMIFDGPFEGASRKPAERDSVQFTVPGKYNTPKHDGLWQTRFYLKGKSVRVYYEASTPDGDLLKALDRAGFYNSLRRECKGEGWKFEAGFSSSTARMHINISKRIRLKGWETDAKSLRTLATYITAHLKARGIKTRGS